jgi:hypothetical protein
MMEGLHFAQGCKDAGFTMTCAREGGKVWGAVGISLPEEGDWEGWDFAERQNGGGERGEGCERAADNAAHDVRQERVQLGVLIVHTGLWRSCNG